MLADPGPAHRRPFMRDRRPNPCGCAISPSRTSTSTHLPDVGSWFADETVGGNYDAEPDRLFWEFNRSFPSIAA